MNCKDCKKWHPIRHTTLFKINEVTKEYEVHSIGKYYEYEDIEKTKENEKLEIKIYDGLCDISDDFIMDNWDGVTVSPEFGCIFFESK